MPEEAGLSAFHFLRPWWLLLVPPVICLYLRLRKAYHAGIQWQDHIETHLLRHLTIGAEQQYRLRPYQLMTAVFLLLTFALAGPAWQPEITPFTEDRAPLIAALELTPGMLATDQPPTRLERAKQKLRDILQKRKGARTAVIAYAGSAHAVLPLTDDVELIELYLDSLSPDLMPEPGDDAGKALQLAEQMLSGEQAAGTIVFLSDGIDRTFADAFVDQARTDQILFLAFGGEPDSPGEGSDKLAAGVDLAGLKSVAGAAGGKVWQATVDDSDINQLLRQVRTHLVNAIKQDGSVRWQDNGYYLAWPLALLVLLWARRGWTVQWS